MKILTEDITQDVHVIKEDVGTDGIARKCYIEGIFLQSDVKNRNGRIYPFPHVANAVHQYEENFIKTGRAMGELGHPENGSINLHLVSHMIESLRADGKNFIGRAKVLDTPMGKIAKTLISEGVRLGVSLRGYGSVSQKEDARIVGKDFTLSTVDIVADPSAPDAFVNGIMENSQAYYNQGILLEEHYDYVQKSVKNMTKTQLNEGELLHMFENFMKTLK